MNQLTSDDNVDRLLSAFFKAEMPDTWPAAPATVTSEPAALAAGRAEAPRNEPAVESRKNFHMR